MKLENLLPLLDENLFIEFVDGSLSYTYDGKNSIEPEMNNRTVELITLNESKYRGKYIAVVLETKFY